MARYLSRSIKPYKMVVVSHINDAFDLAHLLVDFDLESDKFAMNFDVVSQYRSEPIKDSLDYLHLWLILGSSLEKQVSLASLEII